MKLLFAIIISFVTCGFSNGYCEKISEQYIELNSHTVPKTNEDWPVMPSEYYQEQSPNNDNDPIARPLYGPEQIYPDDGYCMKIHTSKIINGEDKNISFNSCNYNKE